MSNRESHFWKVLVNEYRPWVLYRPEVHEVLKRWVGGWMDVWMNGWMDGWVDGGINGWLNGLNAG